VGPSCAAFCDWCRDSEGERLDNYFPINGDDLFGLARLIIGSLLIARCLCAVLRTLAINDSESETCWKLLEGQFFKLFLFVSVLEAHDLLSAVSLLSSILAQTEMRGL
jgi:hypothetical protein